MGRIFEVRKHTMFARWNRMAKQFARIAKDITMAVKAGGPDPSSNPTLRRVIQNARAVNMPKDRIEAAIKRASGRDATNYQEVLYEGYAPYGVALLVETATDNPTRTVAAVRLHRPLPGVPARGLRLGSQNGRRESDLVAGKSHAFCRRVRFN